MIKKIFKNLAIFLIIGTMLLTNLPYRALITALDSYIAASNIVDKAWNLSRDENVVDKFTSYRNLVEKLKIKEAHAAALTYVGGASGTGTGSTYSVSLTALTGGSGSSAAADDLVIVVTGWASTANGDPGVDTAGYTEVYDLWGNDTRDVNASVNWKIMGATPDTSVTVRGFNNAANGGATAVQVWRGAHQTTPMDVTPPAGVTATNGARPDSPSITPVTSGAYVLTVGMGTGDASPLAFTAPTGYNNAISTPGTGSTMSVIANIASKAWTIGAEDPAAWTGGESTTSDSRGAGTLAIRPAADTTLGSGTDPASATVAPESGIRDAGTFTLQTTSGTDSVTALTVILAAAGTPYDGLSEVRVTSDDGVTLYFAAISNPTSNTLNFSGGTAIPVTTTSTPFKIRVTPKTHANMPAPAGAEYALSPRVSAFTSTNAQTGSDSNANTLTIDNLSPNGATSVSGSAGVQAVTVNWTTSNSSDFNTTSGSVVYRWAAASAGTEVPAENSTPAIGSTNGTATVACVTSSAASTAQSKIDGNGGSAECTTTALTGGQAYTYKAFQKDTNGNYDVGVLIGTFTPSSSTVVTVDEIGTQSSPLIIPSTGNYIGGAFTMIRGTGTANVTSITITESGTVDALNNLNNIKLQYDLDTTAPYDCASVSYAAGDTQYGATDTNGFSAANGTSAFTGSVAVSDVQAMCVYVVLDVLSAASDGQTMIVRITNPSTDVAVSAGTVEPSTAQGAGTTTLEVPKITVATEGTQVNMVIGIGDNNVGGAFSFTRNTASANVTSITITDTGTVNANANISDVRVYYKQEGTCFSSIPVDATLFNSTAGTFNVSEKSTVTGTMAVGTSKICVYVRVDVGDGTTSGQTLEIEISNPSTEVTVSAGSVSPETAVAIAGTTTLNLPTYTSQGIPFLYTANNWGTGGSGVSFFLEVYMRQTTGTVYARLLNETDTTAVTGSTLSTTSVSFTRLRTASALTLTDGKTYRVQFGKIGADAGETLGAKLVVNQNGVGGGGADLAEYYSSSDQLDLAEVVAINRSQVAGVRRSDQPYQKDMLGVVATQPGIILGENVGQSYPIALVGRVPVRVITENGQIKVGDYLTSSSTAGHAMKATKAGRVLGQSLETLDPNKLTDCPVSGSSGPQRKCGTVMVFVNLIDYLGLTVELVMEENQSSVLGVQVSDTASPTGLTSSQQTILASLKQFKDKEASVSAGYVSEVFTDRVAAVREVISPLVVTDLLQAKKIKADSIEGLEILTDKISSLQGQVAHSARSSTEAHSKSSGQAGLSTQSDVVATSSAGLSISEESKPTSEVLRSDSSDGVAKFGHVEFESGKFTLDLTILGKLNANGGLIVLGPSEFKGESIFDKLATFISHVIFKDDVTFLGRPTFNKDTAGFAVIEKDADFVGVAFEKEYETTPIVSTSFAFDEFKKDDGTADDQSIRRAKLFEQGYSSMVVNRTKKGFTIVLNKKAIEDITFSWLALAVKDARTSFGKKLLPTETLQASPSGQAPQPSPTASAGTATTSATIEPSISPSQEAHSTGSGQASPSAQ